MAKIKYEVYAGGRKVATVFDKTNYSSRKKAETEIHRMSKKGFPIAEFNPWRSQDATIRSFVKVRKR